ncbi:MAG TPA: hypothetical protein P5279_06850 [Anaerohalosphaeraceae bacterium]|jgi:hypothetical protein|nr:hypothetical protein [Anaerohalosphaeraceae bacterium]HRT50192.1 hypothetical protein [Anaerohalosphaeraceae bacterium]HRT86123.1 hypothetical protein [Anaerohalosphaeraceae bacterium]
MKIGRASHEEPPVRRRHLGAAAGWILGVFGQARKLSAREVAQKDIPGTTRRMHIRLTEEIRNTFRSRWLRKRR